MCFISMYSVLNTFSEYTYFYISKIITSYTFWLVFEIVEYLQCILNRNIILDKARVSFSQGVFGGKFNFFFISVRRNLFLFFLSTRGFLEAIFWISWNFHWLECNLQSCCMRLCCCSFANIIFFSLVIFYGNFR